MALRQDARRNRAALVEAAVDVFRDEGAGAPLDLVARRAGLGRGTLYRHFPDRGALVAAVLHRQVEHLEEVAERHDDALGLERLLVEICRFELDLPGVMAVVRAQAVPRDEVDEVMRRTTTLLTHALERALAAGAVRVGTTVEDLFLVVAMVDGVGEAQTRSTEPVDRDRVVELALRTVRSAERAELPLPVPEPPEPDRRPA